jgi:thioredoxin-like negative regulator of GroEL
MKHILYFTADWCNPCQRTRPVAEELIRDGLIDFVFVDADTEIELLQHFGIKSVPTYILIQDGVEVKRMNGAKTREQFLEFVKDE